MIDVHGDDEDEDEDDDEVFFEDDLLSFVVSFEVPGNDLNKGSCNISFTISIKTSSIFVFESKALVSKKLRLLERANVSPSTVVTTFLKKIMISEIKYE